MSWISDYNPYYELNCNNNINQYLHPDWSEKRGSCDTDVFKTNCTWSINDDCICNLKLG